MGRMGAYVPAHHERDGNICTGASWVGWEYLDQWSGRDESVSRVPLHIESVGVSVSVHHVREWEFPYPCIMRVLKMSVPVHRGEGGSVCSSALCEGWEYLYQCTVRRVGISVPVPHV